jgi:hypothetical protein
VQLPTEDLIGKVAIAVIAALIVYFLTEKLKSSYRIVQLTSRNHDEYYHQFAELYCARIEPDQQISPAVIAEHAVDKRTSPRSRRALKRMHPGTDRYPTAHQLFLAVQRGQVLGFLCVLINVRRSYIFVAYLGVKAPPDAPGGVTAKLLRKVKRRTSGILPNERFLFEVSPPLADSVTSRAKFRLFSEYGRHSGLVSRPVPVIYVQPDMEPESLSGTTETFADLCITADANHLDALSRLDYLKLVRSIYFDIYLKSFPDFELQARYLEYLGDLYTAVAEST